MRIDLKINAWRLSKEGLIEIMEAYPRGKIHPDGIAYTVYLTRGMEQVYSAIASLSVASILLPLDNDTGLEINFFIEDDVMDYAKRLHERRDEEE